jgi:hypothetical protein
MKREESSMAAFSRHLLSSLIAFGLGLAVSGCAQTTREEAVAQEAPPASDMATAQTVEGQDVVPGFEIVSFLGGGEEMGGVAACPAEVQRSAPDCSFVQSISRGGEAAFCFCEGNVTVRESLPIPEGKRDLERFSPIALYKLREGTDPCTVYYFNGKQYLYCW